jgi:hypothetical protein
MALDQKTDLWSLVLERHELDFLELAEAVQDQAAQGPLDFRTRLLIRDSLDALKERWGAERLAAWLSRCPTREHLETIWNEDLGDPGFPSLAQRVMETTKPERIEQFLREIGLRINRPLRVFLGGSGALILAGHLSRRTEDVDLVDEVPPEIRSQHQFLDELRQRYALYLAHFQSHYLPKGWDQRVHSLPPFGRLQVYLVDVVDIFLSKLFSSRAKDLDDLRMLAPQLDKETVVRQLRDTTADLLAAADPRKRAEDNWYIVYGEPLPT